mgnify:CR=1 FL=1
MSVLHLVEIVPFHHLNRVLVRACSIAVPFVFSPLFFLFFRFLIFFFDIAL